LFLSFCYENRNSVIIENGLKQNGSPDHLGGDISKNKEEAAAMMAKA
jgi:hypothetical protein